MMCTYRLKVTAVGCFFICGQTCVAQVVTDGTTGSGETLTGPDYVIGDDLGTRAGDNLFHSFEQFSIATGESATFTGPGDIDNVISRVTGGDISSIDGRLASTIPGASLWLFNPAGVVFGANASLDVTGSFHVSTADELRMADGSRFSAASPASNGFSIAEPEAFGFLGADPAGISIAGSQLEVAEGQTLSVVGGDVDIAGGSLVVDAGQLNVLAASGPAEANVATGDITGATEGDITVDQGSSLLAAGDGGGSIRIEGGEFVVDEASSIASTNTGASDGDVGIDIDVKTAEVAGGSLIVTNATADGDGGSIEIEADDRLVVDGGQIASASDGAGDGGDINIAGDKVAFRDGGFTISVARSSGDGGKIDVLADDLSLTSGSIATFTEEASSGAGGNIVIVAGSIEVRAGEPGETSRIATASLGSGDTGDIDVRGDQVLLDGNNLLNGATIQTLPEGEGSRGGRVRLVVGSLDLLRGGNISANSNGRADGLANIDVTAKRINIDDQGQGRLTGINLAAFSQGETPGVIRIRTSDLNIRNGGLISTITGNENDGGDIFIAAENISLSGQAAANFRTQIVTRTAPGATGDAGDITIVADTIELSGDGSILGTTLSDGDAGLIDITATSNLGMRDNAVISTSTGPSSAGAAGAISISTGDLVLLDGGRIISTTNGSGNAGSINVTADTGLLDARNVDVFGGITTQADAQSTGDAGVIDLTIGDLTILNTSQISSSANGTGRAGNISIRSDNILIDQGSSNSRFLTGITTTAVSEGAGDAGAIVIVADELVLRGDSAQISSASEGVGSAGTIDIDLSESLILDGGADILTSSASAGGGSITIRADQSIAAVGPGSVIETTVFDDTGNAGDIIIETPLLALGDAEILARADAGQGGDIQVTTDDLLLSPDAVIDAEAGATGIDGTVAVSAPESDLTGGIVAFDGSFLDLSSLLRERCAVRRDAAGSSFTLGTGGSLPVDLDAPQPSLANANADQTLTSRQNRDPVLVLPCPKPTS